MSSKSRASGSQGTSESLMSRIGMSIAHGKRQLTHYWRSAHWLLRVAATSISLALLWALAGTTLPSETILALVLACLPIMAGATIALARPQPITSWMDRALLQYSERRDKAAAKETIVSRWFFRPLYAGLYASATWTRRIQDPYLRNGAILAIQIYLVYAALFVAYIAIAVVIVLVMFLFMFWAFSKVFAEDSSSRTFTRSDNRKILRTPFGAARSEVQENLWGDKYVQHFDADGRKIAKTLEKESLWGNQYQETVSQDGEVIGRSEERETIWGDKYKQHFDVDGNESGKSEARESLWGDEYVQHYDQDGDKAGRSELKESLFGQKYVKHTDES